MDVLARLLGRCCSFIDREVMLTDLTVSSGEFAAENSPIFPNMTDKTTMDISVKNRDELASRASWSDTLDDVLTRVLADAEE